jgi:hypothetical protein
VLLGECHLQQQGHVVRPVLLPVMLTECELEVSTAAEGVGPERCDTVTVWVTMSASGSVGVMLRKGAQAECYKYMHAWVRMYSLC